MQAVMNHSSALESFLFAGGRDYMMRSEKRSGSGPAHSAPGGKPPHRRRKRAGFFYKMFMMILLLTIWPLGLLMLWQRKVRWGIATKLLTSVVTLAACIILIGFALTVNTGNPQYTAVQDSVNNFLDSAADTLVETSGIVADYAELMVEDMENVADALWERGKIHIANGIDAGVLLAQQAKVDVLALIENMKPDPEAATVESTEADTAAEVTVEATEETTEAPAGETSAEPEATPAAKTTEVPAAEDAAEDAGAEPTAEAPAQTAEAAETEAVAQAAETGEPVEETEAPDTADAPQAEESAGAEETAKVSEAPAEATPEATAEPTVQPTPQVVSPSVTLKPAALATVYHSTNGQWYHTFNRCSGMTGGGAYTLEECAATHKQCRACSAPAADLIGQPCLWRDAAGLCHTGNDCSAFEGKYTLVLRDDALEQKLSACNQCGAHEYLAPNTIIDYSAAATAEPTPEPAA